MVSVNKILLIKNWFVGFLIILIALNIFLCIALRNNSKYLKLLHSRIRNEQQLIINDKDSILVKQMEFDLMFNKILNKDACDSLIQHKSKVLLLLDRENSCKTCIVSILMDLNILADKIGRDNIIIAADFDNKSELNVYLKDINDGFNSILLKDIVNNKTIKIDEPILLIIGSDYSVKYVFFINYEELDLRELYINDILANYFLFN